MTPLQILAMLERRDVVTTDESERGFCCGIPRDDEGFCQHREYHPIFVSLGEEQ